MTRGGRIDPTRFPAGKLDADDRIDLAIAESFPASDPPSWNSGLERTSEWRIAEIVAATDLGRCSRNAIDHAVALARATGAGLTVVHARVAAPEYDDLYRSGAIERPSRSPRYAALYADTFNPTLTPAFDEEAAAAVARAHGHQTGGLPRVRTVGITGEPAEAILLVAERARASVIVVGSHSRPPLAEALLGSTADAVIRRSNLPVLAVPCDVPRNDDGAIVAVLDEPGAAAEISRRAAAVAAVLRREVITLRVPNDGRVDRRPEVAHARLVVIAFPREQTETVNRRDPNVRVLLRSGLAPILTIPAN